MCQLGLLMILFFAYISLSYESYHTNITFQQIVYWQRSLPYIQQFNDKRCTKASPMAEERFCRKRCQLMFYYIPSAPNKNYRFYNKTTKDCEPKAICPKIFTVFYNSPANKCVDMSTGNDVPSINATPYVGKDAYEVEFVCINGKVGMYKGRQECICDFGWKTKYVAGTRTNPKFQKCNQGISIYEYLPAVLQIYYDPLIDLPYPHPADPEYWSKIMINYLRQLKYNFLTSIWPNQIELTLLVMPQQDTIAEGDKKYVILCGLVLGIILVMSLYQKLKNTRTFEQMKVQEQENK